MSSRRRAILGVRVGLRAASPSAASNNNNSRPIKQSSRLTPFLGGMVRQFQDRPDSACRVSDHGPSEVGNLSSS